MTVDAEEPAWRRYLRMRDQYLANARQAFALQEWSKVTELLWGAVAQGIKALAAARAIHLRRHADLRDFTARMGKEVGDSSFSRAFSDAERMHANFYDHFLSPADVVGHMQATEDLLGRLEEQLRRITVQARDES